MELQDLHLGSDVICSGQSFDSDYLLSWKISCHALIQSYLGIQLKIYIFIYDHCDIILHVSDFNRILRDNNRALLYLEMCINQ